MISPTGRASADSRKQQMTIASTAERIFRGILSETAHRQKRIADAQESGFTLPAATPMNEI